VALVSRSRTDRDRRPRTPLTLGSALLSLLLTATLLALSPSPASAALRVPPRAQGLWDGGDNYEICHGSRWMSPIA
jgi:hypothetical protein